MFTVENTVCLLYLLFLSVIDMRRRMIPASLLGAGCAAAIVIRIVRPTVPPALAFAGMAAGLAFLALSRVTREQIGYGDSILITGLGIFSGILRLLELLLTAFLMAAVFSAGLLAARKFHRGARYPFVPFLSAAFFVMICAKRMA